MAINVLCFLSAPKKCGQDEFACSSGACLKKTWHCDGRDDCIDGSDEKNCSKFSCYCVSILVSDPMLLKSSMKHAVPMQFSLDLVVNLFGLFKWICVIEVSNIVIVSVINMRWCCILYAEISFYIRRKRSKTNFLLICRSVNIQHPAKTVNTAAAEASVSVWRNFVTKQWIATTLQTKIRRTAVSVGPFALRESLEAAWPSAQRIRIAIQRS